MNEKYKIWYLYATVFIAGLVVLALEILGSRIISPYFGNTLYVWSSLLSVAIASLAIGYYIGGWIADKKPVFNLLYLFILFAGIAIIIIPKIDATILVFASSFGVRLGAFFATAVLFSVPIILLGTIAPFAIKLRAKGLENLGTTAGSLYATETLGGFVGAIITGFFLIPVMGISKITIILASLLFLVAGIWFIVNRKPKTLLILLPLIPFLFFPSSVNDGNEAIVYQTQSILGEVKVIDRGSHRILLIDGSTQAYVERGGLQTSSSFAQKVPYMYFMNPDMKNVLVLGLGSGILSRDLRDKYNLNVDTVDINEDVLYVAQTYFGFDGNIYIEDARTYIRNTSKKYDAIVFDIARGDGYSVHNFTQEAFREAKNALTPDGIMVINFNGPASSPKVTSLFKTLDSVFENVFTTTSPDKEGILSRKFFFATDSEIDKEEIKKNISIYVESLGQQETLVNVIDNYLIESMEGGVLVTDDYNPLDNFQVESTIAWRERNWGIFGDLLLR